ncbi:hypothetical protein L3X38_009937 [Prunus dulcis]|uniref:DUF7746 domain-containing protein n=1 Tax=Prunus dulcis TaxID=3755 RepID=A0AAD4WHC4_PRUDU|nr:hypothetical protein L3X38_009937 [Prunus dulcis]
MVANSYITNHSFRQSEIVPLLVTGFTGTLRYWWDKHLTPESENQITYAVKLNEDGLPIFDERIGQGIEDGVNTLFYTIIEHFIGTPSNTTARIHDQLKEDKEKLIQVLELRDSETSPDEHLVPNSESDTNQSSDLQPSSPGVQIGCTDKCCNRLKSICVLTKQEEQEELLIDLIGKVENPELKSEYLKKLKKVLSQESSNILLPSL